LIIRKLKKEDLANLVNLHYSVLPNEFLTSVSKSFLLGFYQNLFFSPHSHFLGTFASVTTKNHGTDDPNNFKLWVAEAEGVPSSARTPTEVGGGHRTGRASDRTHFHLVAAIVGLEEKYKPKLDSYLLLFLKNLPFFLAKLDKLVQLVQSFIFKLKDKQETEIFFIGVSPKYQGQGLGKKLIAALEKTLLSEYKTLSVDCKCKLPSNKFYQACGFRVKKKFRLYNEDWNRYEKVLSV